LSASSPAAGVRPLPPHLILSAVEGKTYPAVTSVIEPGRVADFARAIGADPAEGVPPTFAAVYALAATGPQLFGDPDAAVDFARLLHADQEFEWERHPQSGETVTSQGNVVSDVSRRGMRFLTFEIVTKGEDGSALCRARTLFIVRVSKESSARSRSPLSRSPRAPRRRATRTRFISTASSPAR